MKIHYIITRSDTIGGAQVHVYDLAKAMQDLGHDVTVLVGGRGIFYVFLQENGINVIELKNLRRELNIITDFFAFLELFKILLKTKPNLVTLHSSKAGLIGRIAALFLRIPTIFTAHGWSFADGVDVKKRKFFAFIEKCLGTISSHVITVSKADKRLAQEFNVLNTDTMTAIHNGVKPVELIKCSEKSKIFRLVCIARFSEQKDHETLLRALSLISNKNWELDLIGDGPLESKMIALTEKLGLSNNVNFLGLRQDIPVLLAKANLFVLISNWEGLPISILEAMSAALPIVASDVGGVSEAVQDNYNGRILPRGDTEKLKYILEDTIGNYTLMEFYGQNSKLMFEEKFTFKRQFEQTYKLYKEYSI